MPTPTYLPALALAMCIAMNAAAFLGLNRALLRCSLPAGTRAWVLRAAAPFLIGVPAVALALALVGEGAGGRPATIQTGLVAATALAGVLAWRSAWRKAMKDWSA